MIAQATAPLVPGWCAFGTFVLAAIVFGAAALLARRGGVDRSRIEGRWAGYDATDIGTAMAAYGEAGARVYRNRLIPLDALFALLVILAALLLGAWAAGRSASPLLGMMAGGPLVAAGIVDIREGLALRELLVWGREPKPSQVALAAARTRIKLSLYAAGSITAALASLGLTIGWLWGSLLVAAAIAGRTIYWLRS